MLNKLIEKFNKHNLTKIKALSLMVSGLIEEVSTSKKRIKYLTDENDRLNNLVSSYERDRTAKG